MTKSVLVRVIAGAALAAAPGVVQGQSLFFGEDLNGGSSTRASSTNTNTARNNFLSFLVQGVRTEEFESQLVGAVAPLALDFGSSAGVATLNPAGTTGSVVNDGGNGTSTNGRGRYANTNPAYYETRSTRSAQTSFAIDFSNPIAAFGFVGIDIGDFGSQLSLVFLRGGETVFTFGLPYVASNGTDTLRDGSRLFAGVIAENASQLFDRVEFRGTDTDDVFAFDDLTIAAPSQVVPEPTTVGLLAAGLVGLAGLVRRRGRSA